MNPESYTAKDINEYYDAISKDKLLERLEMFRTLHFESMSIDDIQDCLKKVFLWKSPASIPHSMNQAGAASFYRIRTIKLENEAESIYPAISEKGFNDKGETLFSIDVNLFEKIKESISSLKSEEEFWEAPPEYTAMGRANDKGEPILYLTLSDVEAAELETKTKINDFFILITYRCKKDQFLNLTKIGPASMIIEDLSDTTKEKIDIIGHFLTEEAMRNEANDKTKYKISNAIFKFMRECAGQETDGWAHTSVHMKEINLKLQEMNKNLQLTTNVCLLPEIAHKKLEVHNVQICIAGDRRYYPIAYLEKYNKEGKPIFCWVEPSSINT